MHDASFGSSSSREPPSGPSQPYLEWARATDFTYLRGGAWLPLLVEFNPDALAKDPELTPLQVFASRKWLSDDPQSLDDSFVVPEVFAKLPKVLRQSRELSFCVVLVRRDEGFLRQLTSSKAWNTTILSAHLGPPVDLIAPHAHSIANSVAGGTVPFSPATAPPYPPAPPPPPGPVPSPLSSGASSSPSVQRVVMAVIDQGIAFANAKFWNGNQPRIEYLWQQDFLGSTIPAWSSTMTFTPGIEITSGVIIAATNAARAIGAGDDWLYRKYGGVDFSLEGYKPLARRRTHGTHVLDLAAANSASSQHPIIAVDMPEDAVGDPAGSTLSVHAAWGLIYILSRAEQLLKPGETLPVVANLSYGPHEGPHDGTGEFERFMDQVVKVCAYSVTPLAVVLAAGNFRQSRTHAAIHLQASRKEALRWRLQPGSLTPSLLEIWLPRNVGSDVSVTLRPPNGNPITVSAIKLVDSELTAGTVLYWANYIQQTSVPNSQDPVRAHVVLSIARTAVDPSGTWGQAVAPSGRWSVEIESKRAIQVEAWIKRSDTLSGRRAKGRQSYFDDTAYRQHMNNGRPCDFDEQAPASYVRRLQTLSGIATGQRTLVIGGYCVADRYPAIYSSHGSRTLGNINSGPNWLERSDDTVVCRGVLASGTMSGSTIAMNGSSVSAPQAARAIADQWLAKQAKPANPPILQPGIVDPQRPITAGEVAFAFGGGLAPSVPYKNFPKR